MPTGTWWRPSKTVEHLNYVLNPQMGDKPRGSPAFRLAFTELNGSRSIARRAQRIHEICGEMHDLIELDDPVEVLGLERGVSLRQKVRYMALGLIETCTRRTTYASPRLRPPGATDEEAEEALAEMRAQRNALAAAIEVMIRHLMELPADLETAPITY